MESKISKLFNIRFPIVSGGMVWCSGWRLAAAVSEAGGLGLIGAGSMHPDVLREHIIKCRRATSYPFGVNVPLTYPNLEELFEVIIAERVGIVFTSAGNPALYTQRLKDAGILVAHVVASSKFALKAETAGVDALVVEGYEAGGHNGREETTTLVLTEAVCRKTALPVIAAGGITSGRGLAAAFALGAEGVQMGTRFALSVESSAHLNYKMRALSLPEGETAMCLRKTSNIRMIRNDVCCRILDAESQGMPQNELCRLVGEKRAKRGIFEGDIEEGFLEIGEGAVGVHRIEHAADIVREVMEEAERVTENIARRFSLLSDTN